MDTQAEVQETVDEQYEWRNVQGNVEHKRCLTDDGRVVEVYRQEYFSTESPFAYVWNIFTIPGVSTKWGNTSTLMEAMHKAELYAKADEDGHESAE